MLLFKCCDLRETGRPAERMDVACMDARDHGVEQTTGGLLTESPRRKLVDTLVLITLLRLDEQLANHPQAPRKTERWVRQELQRRTGQTQQAPRPIK